MVWLYFGNVAYCSGYDLFNFYPQTLLYL